MITARDILVPGASGKCAWRGGSIAETHQVLVDGWVNAVHAYAKRLGGRHSPTQEPALGRNYWSIQVHWTVWPPTANVYTDSARSTDCEILLHNVLPYVAARQVSKDCTHSVFVECTSLSERASTRLRVLGADLLNTPCKPQPWMQDQLDPASWYDLHHFQPESIGDFLFNFYD